MAEITHLRLQNIVFSFKLKDVLEKETSKKRFSKEKSSKKNQTPNSRKGSYSRIQQPSLYEKDYGKLQSVQHGENRSIISYKDSQNEKESEAKTLLQTSINTCSGYSIKSVIDNLLKRAQQFGDSIIKSFSNFIVVKFRKKSFVIFTKTGHINCTGTRRYHRLHQTITTANILFGFKLRFKHITIQNTTISGKISSKRINLYKVQKILQHQESGDYSAKLCPDLFPAAILRSPNFPTCLLFASGSFVFLGAKLKSSIHHALQILQRLAKRDIF